jgi:peptidoglycan/xylan/chitin deacetylase (PgdA/CDA1 family)
VSIRGRAIRGLASAVYYGGVLGPTARVVARLRANAGIPILSFHRVNDERDPFFPSMPTAMFAARMQHIARNYLVLSLDEVAERLGRGRMPRNALALTFDDGYRDFFTHAAPILARFGLPATVFLATGFIGTTEMAWYDGLATAVKTGRRDALELASGETLPLLSAAQRLVALRELLRRLKGLPDEDRQAAIEDLVRRLDPVETGRPKRLMLTWDEVVALKGLGFSIGAHTVSHPILARMTAEVAWREIHGSKVAIERILGTPVRTFAYPNGGVTDYDSSTVDLVRRAGFSCAVSTRRGLNTHKTPIFELRRGGPWEEHLPTYALKLFYYQMSGA